MLSRRVASVLADGRLAFLLLLVCYAIVDGSLLRWVPRGMDTGEYWATFYYNYAELYHHHGLAHWFPYGAYGQPSTLYNFMGVTSTDYLMMFIGKLFGVESAVRLFQFSIIGDHLIFLFGVYLLSRSLFERTGAVMLCAIGSICLLHGLHLTFIQVFRIFSWYPLILYFLTVFFRDSKPTALWTAGTLFVLWCSGNSYVQPFMLLALVPYVLLASWRRPRAWLSVFSTSRSNLIGMAVCVTLALVYLYLALNILDGIAIVREGRSPDGAADLESFLGYRDHSPFKLTLTLLSEGNFYIGLLPVVCIVWGLLQVRTPAFVSFMTTAAILLWFSLGGLFALGLYHVPTFSGVRFLYMTYYIMRVVLLMAAGAAWDSFRVSGRGYWRLLLVAAILVFAIDAAHYGSGNTLTPQFMESRLGQLSPVFNRVTVYLALLAVGALLVVGARRWTGKPWRFGLVLPVALLAGLLFDAISYNLDSKRINPQRTVATCEECRVRELTWQPERLEQPSDPLTQAALEDPTYFNTYGFAQFDPCSPDLLVLSMSEGMDRLVQLRGRNDRSMKTVLGCRAPKARLLARARYYTTDAQAEEAIRRSTDLTHVAVLQLPPDVDEPPGSDTGPRGPAGSVEVTAFRANAIEFRTQVTAPDGAWLVYADAYDTRWKAWVDDERVPIARAYLDLKAVHVPNGESVVRMAFTGVNNMAQSLLAVCGAACSLLLLSWCGLCCVRGFPSRAETG